MKKIILFCLLIALSCMTFAAEPKGTVCWANIGKVISYDYELKFNCSDDISLNKISIEELYQKGYRVVSSNMDSNSNGVRNVTIIIEKINLK